MRYLVDTDWIIDGISGIPAALDMLSRLAVEGVTISIVTLGEVFVRTDVESQPGPGWRPTAACSVIEPVCWVRRACARRPYGFWLAQWCCPQL